MKKLFCFLSLLLTVFLLTACGDKEGDVFFLNFKPEVKDIYEEIAEAYTKKTGVKVNVATAASGTYEQTLQSEMVKRDAPTIFQINGPVGYNTWKDNTYDLKDTRLYEILLDKSIAITGEDGGVYGIPFAIEGYGLVINKDVFNEYFAQANRADTSLTKVDDIDSFADFKKVVEDLDAYIKGDKTATSAPTIDKLEGVFASSSLKKGSYWPFQTHLANIPFYYEFLEKNENNAILGGLAIESEKLEFKYNNEYKNIFDLYLNYGVRPKAQLGEVDNNMATVEFATGKAAIYQQGNWIYNDILKVKKDNVITVENIGMMPIYTGHTGEENLTIPVGTENYFCINNESSKADIKASIAFLEWLFTSDEGKEYVVEKLAFIAPFSTFEEDEKPVDPLAREVLRLMEKPGKKTIPWAFAAFPSNAFKDAFGDALLLYSQGQKTWADLVKDVKAAWIVE